MSLAQIMTMLDLSDLQFALAAIGLLILLVVAIFNLKFARARCKARESANLSAEARFAGGFADAERVEPSFSSAAPLPIQSIQYQSIDPRIDCVITLRFDEPILGGEILKEINAWPALDGVSSARWICEGLSADVNAAEDWEVLHPETPYSDLQLAIQLASRRGPIGVLELSDFCSRVQGLAETLDSQIDMPSVNTMLEAATELDAMAAESDIQLSINVLFSENFSWSALQALMLQRGFKLARNGRQFEYFDQEQLLFTSAELDPNGLVTQLTLLLEVPLVDSELRPFERMLGEGIEIAQASHGRLVDDNGTNLTEAAVISIRQHLETLYANLETGGIAAGSSTAIRLFS